MAYYQIRTSDGEAGELLQHLAEEDMRSIGQEVAWLIRQEHTRRHEPKLPIPTFLQVFADAITSDDRSSTHASSTTSGTRLEEQEPAPCSS